MKSIRLVALGLTLASAGLASATSMVPMSISALTERASTVVRVKVERSAGAWGPAQRHIYTYSEVEVSEVLRGEVQLGAQLLVRSLGGEIGGQGMRVPGAPRLVDGEDVVLFLQEAPKEPGVFRVVGMSQGLYRVVEDGSDDPKLVSGMAGVALVGDSGVRTEALKLSALKAQVKAAAETQAVPR